jgi:hypothetical protein
MGGRAAGDENEMRQRVNVRRERREVVFKGTVVTQSRSESREPPRENRGQGKGSPVSAW